MKESLLTIGMAFLSVGSYSQNKTQNLENLISSFESIKAVQEVYEKLCEHTSEVSEQKVKEACLMSAYENALEYMGPDNDIRQAVYELDSLVQTHKISPQYIKNLLSPNTLEMAKSKYMIANSELENSSIELNKNKKRDALKAEYEAIAEIQSGAEHVQKLYPSFDKERIAKYLEGAFYMKDTFENWKLHKPNNEAEKFFEFLKMNIQSYPYAAAKYVDNVLDKELPKKLAKEFYDDSKKFVDKLSDDEYEKIDEYDANLLRPNYLLTELEKNPSQPFYDKIIKTVEKDKKINTTKTGKTQLKNNHPIKKLPTKRISARKR